jgi:hypothetical protein
MTVLKLLLIAVHGIGTHQLVDGNMGATQGPEGIIYSSSGRVGYAVVIKIIEKPAFAWWAKHVWRKRDRIFRKVKSRYWTEPTSMVSSFAQDSHGRSPDQQESGTGFSPRSIELEMKAILDCAFELRDDDKMPVGYQHIDCHIIFDRKADSRWWASNLLMATFKRYHFCKCRHARQHTIAFTVAALIDLEVPSAYVSWAYLNANAVAKVYMTTGTEFGPA